MSKLSFRARALDATKPLPIYHAEDLPDLSDYSTINRTVPQMPTGMEKEEEAERHLQDVILAKQTNNVKKKHIYIPTPEAAIPVSHYEDISQRINRGTPYVRVPGLGLEEVPDYDLDSEDEEWLNAQTNERPLSPTHFERMMDRLEKGSGNTVLSEREAQALLRDDENLVLAVYDYWLAKRLRLGRALIPVVKHEGRDGGSGSNPYLAFRKRTEKMQTRKNRKNDETAYMQMLKLKRDLEKAISLFEWVKEREQKKEDIAQVRMDIFRKRYLLEDWSGSILSSLHPASTKSATSRQNSSIDDGGWENRGRLIKMESSGDYDVQHVGRHEVLVSSGLKRKRKKKYYYQDVHSEAPITPSTPDKVQRDSSHDLSSDRLEDEESEGVFSFKRKPHVHYHSCRDPLSAWPWFNEGNLSSSMKDPPGDNDMMIVDYSPYALSNRNRPRYTEKRRKYRYSRTSLSGHFIGLSRRRIGRGGRVLWDRATNRSSIATVNAFPPENYSPTTSSDLAGEKKEQEKDKDGSIKSTPMQLNAEVGESEIKCQHFHTQSPSPTAKFEFQYLPLIEQGHSDNVSTSSNPPSNGLSSIQSIPFSGISLAFRGISMNSEFREDAKTFSSLPTSQFFLKSSSPHSEIDYQGLLLGSESSWGLHQANVKGPVDSRPNVFKRTNSDYGTSSTNSPLHPSSTPINYPIGNSANESSSANTDRGRLNQQVPTKNEQSTSKELSRSSLSVADSKTIVLSNVPRPKHQLEKSQRLLQSEKSTKDSTHPPVQAASVKPQTPPIQKDKSAVVEDTSSTSKNKSVSSGIDSLSKNTPESNKARLKDDASTDASTQQKIITPTVTDNKTAVQTSSEPVSDSKQSTAGSTAVAEHRDKTTQLSTMNTPDNNVLEFDAPPQKKRHKSVADKKIRTSVATLNTANLITTQLGQHSVLGKKDVLGVVSTTQNTMAIQPSTVLSSNDLLKSGVVTSSISSVSALNATKLAEIQSSLLNSQEKATTVTVPNVSSGLSGYSDGRATVSSIPSNSAVTHKVGSTGAVSVNSHVGQAISTVTSAVARRASTGTNGTNSPDIFHTTRRISESAERGLKQALAGMNRNSLIETANSLVQLSNSSEVT